MQRIAQVCQRQPIPVLYSLVGLVPGCHLSVSVQYTTFQHESAFEESILVIMVLVALSACSLRQLQESFNLIYVDKICH